MRPTIPALAATLSALVLALPSPAGAAVVHEGKRPSTYVVSETPGTLPEGIHVTRDGTMYVTSKGTGAVYRGSVRDPHLRLWLPGGQDGRVTATGVHTDPYGRVLVAGAESSTFFVYSPDGTLLWKQTTDASSFLNDFAFGGGFVYVTDSANGTVYRAPVNASGVGRLEPFVSAADFPVTPDFLNGIVANHDGSTLLVADWLKERTFRIDTRTGTVSLLDVHGGTLGGDGLLHQGRTLWAVHNTTDATGSTTYWTREVRLDRGWRTARVVDDSVPAEPGIAPTTIARDRGRLLWVESQFDMAESMPPYLVTEVRGVN